MNTRHAPSTDAPSTQAPSTDDSPLCLRRQLCFALYAASNQVTRLYRPVLEPLGLTYPQYLVMLVLWERAPRKVGEIAEQLLLDSGTLTPLLKRMEANGLLTRTRDPHDERCVCIALTAAGRGLKRRAAGIPAKMLDAIDLPLQQLEALKTQLQTLTISAQASESA